MDNVRVVCGDGGLGYADHAPYDRIVLTVGAWDIVPAWWEQLKPGGRLLLPLEIAGGIQKSIAFDKMDEHLESVSVRDCGFMTLRGAFAKPQVPISFGLELGLSISVDSAVSVNGDAVYGWLSGQSEDQPSGVLASPPEVVFGGLALWLSLREPGLCVLFANGQISDLGIVPQFMKSQGEPKWNYTIGLLGDGELCVFVLPPKPERSSVQPDGSQSLELFVRRYGSGIELAKRLVEQARAWHAAGRPSSSGLRIRAYPKDADYLPSTDEYRIDKRWTKLVLDWE